MKHARLRQWHTILGTLFALPLIVMCVTGSLIIHNRTLGFRTIQVSTDWLPGYHTNEAQENVLKEVRSILQLPNGHLLVGTENGLVEVTAKTSHRIPGIPNTP